MQEIEFYSDKQVKVTSSRVVVGDQTFSLRNISSVRTVETPPQRVLPSALLIVGTFVAISGMRSIEDGGMINIVLGLIGVVTGIPWLMMASERCAVVFRTSGGEVTALESKDCVMVRRAAYAINEAIASLK